VLVAEKYSSDQQMFRKKIKDSDNLYQASTK